MAPDEADLGRVRHPIEVEPVADRDAVRGHAIKEIRHRDVRNESSGRETATTPVT